MGYFLVLNVCTALNRSQPSLITLDAGWLEAFPELAAGVVGVVAPAAGAAAGAAKFSKSELEFMLAKLLRVS